MLRLNRYFQPFAHKKFKASFCEVRFDFFDFRLSEKQIANILKIPPNSPQFFKLIEAVASKAVLFSGRKQNHCIFRKLLKDCSQEHITHLLKSLGFSLPSLAIEPHGCNFLKKIISRFSTKEQMDIVGPILVSQLDYLIVDVMRFNVGKLVVEAFIRKCPRPWKYFKDVSKKKWEEHILDGKNDGVMLELLAKKGENSSLVEAVVENLGVLTGKKNGIIIIGSVFANENDPKILSEIENNLLHNIDRLIEQNEFVILRKLINSNNKAVSLKSSTDVISKALVIFNRKGTHSLPVLKDALLFCDEESKVILLSWLKNEMKSVVRIENIDQLIFFLIENFSLKLSDVLKKLLLDSSETLKTTECGFKILKRLMNK